MVGAQETRRARSATAAKRKVQRVLEPAIQRRGPIDHVTVPLSATKRTDELARASLVMMRTVSQVIHVVSVRYASPKASLISPTKGPTFICVVELGERIGESELELFIPS